MKKSFILPVILGAASLLLAILSLFLLPDTVIVQFTPGSTEVTTMPRLAAIAIPSALGIGGAVGGLLLRPDESRVRKSLFVSAVGAAVFVIMLIVNCLIK